VQVENSCSVKELIHSEDDIPVCGKVMNDTWDDVFFWPVAKHSSSKDSDIDSIELWSEADDVYIKMRML